MNKTNAIGIYFLGLALAVGIALAGYFASQTIVNGRIAVNTATVKGLAERSVKADLAQWEINFYEEETAPGDVDLQQLYTRTEDKQKKILDALAQVGFDDLPVQIAPLRYDVIKNTDNMGVYTDTTHRFLGHIEVSTTDLKRIQNGYHAVAELPKKGVAITVSSPRYLFTKLNEIKPDMLREATQNARLAAEEFAKNANVSVGGIQLATQGGFSVRDKGLDYTDDKTQEKTVRVITTITFYLDN